MSGRTWHMMSNRRQSLLMGSVVTLLLLCALVWLALGVESFYRLAPPGSDEFRVQVVNTAQVQLSYRLPRGLSWLAVYESLTNQGWVLRDEELLEWPDLIDD